MSREFDEKMMRRALQIARGGEGLTSPNPMVGAVITTPGGLIVGEGFTSPWGGPHAEVNAVRSVKDPSILPQCTIYVTLEPCSHQGKTPPCADMLVSRGLRRCVVGTKDPFAEVSGRGIERMRAAAMEVQTGILEKECRELNRRFILAHTLRRVYVILKWAQSADGFMARADGSPAPLSSPRTRVLMHRERALTDAILAGSGTILTDNPRLDCRLWPNRILRPVIPDVRGRVDAGAAVVRSNPIFLREPLTPLQIASKLYEEEGYISLMVEGGPSTLRQWLRSGIYDELRVEVSSLALHNGPEAPHLPPLPFAYTHIDTSTLLTWRRPLD